MDLKPVLIGFASAVVGTVLVLVLWHVWSDHLLLHQVVTALTSKPVAAAPTPTP